jgi:hypothetical protein
MNVEPVANAYAKGEQQITSCFVLELTDGANAISINPNNALQNPRYKQTSDGLER